MRILVISDSHGADYKITDILNRHSDIKEVFFLGDNVADAENAQINFPDRCFHIVSGNCDYFAVYPFSDIFFFEGKKIFFTHGHRFKVKYSLEELFKEGEKQNADLILFGHTHTPYEHYENGRLYLNPGSLSRSREGSPTYATVEIRKNGILANIMEY